jgi:hypothetical protein
MKFSFDDVKSGAHFVLELPRFLRRPIAVESARAILAERLAHRDADFLALVEQAVYGNPASPYRALLGLAGCEYGDLAQLVSREGVEGALATLYRQGVYLSIDEFKGRQPAVRGSATVEIQSSMLHNVALGPHFTARSGGSRGQGTAVPLHLESVRDAAVDPCLILAAQGGLGWRHAVWRVPGGLAIVQLLQLGCCGVRPARWFSQVDPAAPGLHARYRWSARALRLGSLLAGRPLPAAELVPIDDPLPIARWMSAVRRRGEVPHLNTSVSPAVRLCEAALAAGIDLRGARFSIAGEPLTAVRLALIRQTGAEAVPFYAAMEAGIIGHGCLAPEASDDVHVLDDLHALVSLSGSADRPGLPPGALLVSSLRPTARLILLNVSFGDQGVLARRACGCPLEGLGWTAHLHGVRSFEKLTAGGMTFLDADVIRVLEEVLPSRFGGGPADYQLVEEADDGRPVLQLLVDPALGPLDPGEVADAFLTALGSGSDVGRVMQLQWRQSGLLRVQRERPRSTPGGKILHLHAVPQATNPRPRR